MTSTGPKYQHYKWCFDCERFRAADNCPVCGMGCVELTGALRKIAQWSLYGREEEEDDEGTTGP